MEEDAYILEGGPFCFCMTRLVIFAALVGVSEKNIRRLIDDMERCRVCRLFDYDYFATKGRDR